MQFWRVLSRYFENNCFQDLDNRDRAEYSNHSEAQLNKRPLLISRGRKYKSNIFSCL